MSALHVGLPNGAQCLHSAHTLTGVVATYTRMVIKYAPSFRTFGKWQTLKDYHNHAAPQTALFQTASAEDTFFGLSEK